LCARFGDGVGGLSLENIAKDWLGFLPLLRRVSQDTSCVLVHGYSSCDLGLNKPFKSKCDSDMNLGLLHGLWFH
jgi:hypothetical protein